MAVLEVSKWDGDICELEQMYNASGAAPATGLKLARIAVPAPCTSMSTAGGLVHGSGPGASRKRFYVLEPLGVWVKRGKPDQCGCAGGAAATAALPAPAGLAAMEPGATFFPARTYQAAPAPAPRQLPCYSMSSFAAAAASPLQPQAPLPGADLAAAAAAAAATGAPAAPSPSTMLLSSADQPSWGWMPPTATAVALPVDRVTGCVVTTTAPPHDSNVTPPGCAGPCWGGAAEPVRGASPPGPAASFCGSPTSLRGAVPCIRVGASDAAGCLQRSEGMSAPVAGFMVAPQATAWQGSAASFQCGTSYDAAPEAGSLMWPPQHQQPAILQQQQQQQPQWQPRLAMPPPQQQWQPLPATPPPPLRRQSSGFEQLQRQVWRCWEMWQQEQQPQQQQREEHAWQQQQKMEEKPEQLRQQHPVDGPATAAPCPQGEAPPRFSAAAVTDGILADCGCVFQQVAGPAAADAAIAAATTTAAASAATATAAASPPSPDLWRAWGLSVVEDTDEPAGGDGGSAGADKPKGDAGPGSEDVDGAEMLSLLGSLRELLGSQSREGLLLITPRPSAMAAVASSGSYLL